MNFAISVAESATSPREMKYLIPLDFKDQIYMSKVLKMEFLMSVEVDENLFRI